MTGYATAAIAFAVAVLLGFSVALGAPIFAVPIVLAVLAVMGVVAVRRRAAARPMRSEDVEFTKRDRDTLAESPSSAERAENRRAAARQLEESDG